MGSKRDLILWISLRLRAQRADRAIHPYNLKGGIMSSQPQPSDPQDPLSLQVKQVRSNAKSASSTSKPVEPIYDPWEDVEEAIERFEVAWRADAEPELAAFLDGFNASIRNLGLTELIKIDIECRWKSGRPIGIEKYLDRWPELRENTELVVELIQSECLVRALFATIPSVEEIQERFGDLASRIDLAEIETEADLDRFQADGEAPTVTARSTVPTTRKSPPVFLPHLAGQTFGHRYEIREPIDGGGEGNVYRAFDFRMQRDVALKFPRYSDEKVLARFIREPKVASAVEDLHICRIYDTDTINGLHFIAMELIRGKTVEQEIKETGQFDPFGAAEITCKVANALAKVHAAGIVHRDIKSSNIMFREGHEPVLVDFGLAKPSQTCTGLTTTGEFVGTLAFMSPEQARGDPADARSDIYGLGVVLYHMLTGSVPFSESPTDCLIQKQKPPTPSPIDRRPELDPVIDGICRKALAISPEDRYQSADDLADALKLYMEEQPQVIQLPPRESKMSWWIIGSGIAALLLFVGAIASSIFMLKPSVIEGFPEIPEPPAGIVDRWIETTHPDGIANSSALAIQLASDGERLFVTHTGTKNGCLVRGLDFVSGKDLFEPIRCADYHPHNDLVLSSDERYLFVTNYYKTYITRIDLENNNWQTNIPFVEKGKSGSWWDDGLAITPDGKKLVITLGVDKRLPEPNSKINDGLAIVNISGKNHRLLKRIPLPDEPCSRNIAISADGQFAYLVTQPHPPSNTPRLYEIQLNTPYKFRSLPFPDKSELVSLALSSKLGKLFVSDKGQRKIWTIDLASFPNKRPQEYFHLNERVPATLLVDETRELLVVLSSEWKTLFILDARDGRILSQIKGLRNDCGDLALTPDGKSVLVASTAPRGGVAVIQIPEVESRIVFSSDRGGATSQIYTMNVDGTDIKPFFSKQRIAMDWMPRWSPDGSRIAFLSNEHGNWHVCVADYGGLNVRIFEETTPAENFTIDWSPDGQLIAFINKDRREIHLVDVENGSVSAVPVYFSEPYNQPTDFCWAADGYIVAEVIPSNWAPHGDLFRIDPKTGAIKQLTDEKTTDEHCAAPAVSRDGQIACLRKLVRDDSNPDLYLSPENYRMPAALAPKMWTAVTEGGLYHGHGHPRWFPDSQRIIYTDGSDDELYRKIFVVDTKTRKIFRLTTGKWDDMSPDVSQRIADLPTTIFVESSDN